MRIDGNLNSIATVLMSTFKNNMPENPFILMNTPRTTRIFTVSILYLNDHYNFSFSPSNGT